MEALIDTLVNTEWGLIILGSFLIISLLIQFYNNRNPRI